MTSNRSFWFMILSFVGMALVFLTRNVALNICGTVIGLFSIVNGAIGLVRNDMERRTETPEETPVTPSASPRWGVQVQPWWLDFLKVASLTVLAGSALLVAAMQVTAWNAAREPDISVRTIPPLPKHHREVLDDRCVAVFPSADDKYPQCSVFGPDRDDGSSQVASVDGFCSDGLIARLHAKLHGDQCAICRGYPPGKVPVHVHFHNQSTGTGWAP